jgi:uncharacterized protein YydD (DUF2326 family)
MSEAYNIQKLSNEIHRLRSEIYSMKNKFRNDEKELMNTIGKMNDRIDALYYEINIRTGGDNE